MGHMNDLAEALIKAQDLAVAAEARATEAESRVMKLEEALTPSADTKAAYIGEFSWEERSDDYQGPITRTVPWTTTKQIMAAILARANARTALGGTKA